jgi:hypothetical protein
MIPAMECQLKIEAVSPEGMVEVNQFRDPLTIHSS